MVNKGILLLFCILLGLMASNAQTGKRIVVNEDIELLHLQDSVFVHVTWHQLASYGRFSSNGLIVIKNGKALMIDTPMDNAKTERLVKFLKDSFSVEVTKLISGHYHDDCLGGLGYLQSLGVESIASSLTVSKCKELGLPVPSTPFAESYTFDFNGEPIDCRFLGAGHSFDNIIVWLPGKKILFGGCLIRAANAQSLGNLSDAVVADWDGTVKKLQENFQDIKTIIPGHGDIGGPELLTHTISLVEKEKSKVVWGINTDLTFSLLDSLLQRNGGNIQYIGISGDVILEDKLFLYTSKKNIPYNSRGSEDIILNTDSAIIGLSLVVSSNPFMVKAMYAQYQKSDGLIYVQLLPAEDAVIIEYWKYNEKKKTFYKSGSKRIP